MPEDCGFSRFIGAARRAIATFVLCSVTNNARVYSIWETEGEPHSRSSLASSRLIRSQCRYAISSVSVTGASPSGWATTANSMVTPVKSMMNRDTLAGALRDVLPKLIPPTCRRGDYGFIPILWFFRGSRIGSTEAICWELCASTEYCERGTWFRSIVTA